MKFYFNLLIQSALKSKSQLNKGAKCKVQKSLQHFSLFLSKCICRSWIRAILIQNWLLKSLHWQHRVNFVNSKLLWVNKYILAVCSGAINCYIYVIIIYCQYCHQGISVGSCHIHIGMVELKDNAISILWTNMCFTET